MRKDQENSIFHALIYCRVSSDKQKNEGHGLEAQEQRCKEHAQKKKYKVEAIFKESFSGGGDYKKRPELTKLLQYIDDNPLKHFVVIIDDLSRFARDVVSHFQLKNHLLSRGVNLECTNFNFEDTPEGELIETVMAAQHQYHRKNNKRQVVQKMKARLEAGYWSFTAKSGYKMIKDRIHGKISVPDGKRAKILKRALEGFSMGEFQRKIDICDYLIKNGYWNGKRPEKFIDNITDIIKDPFYAGYILYSKWGVDFKKGKHKSIISLETYKRNLERLRDGGSVKRIRKDLNSDFPLRGLVKCAKCGDPLTAAWSKGRTKRYPYYFCQNKNCELRGKSIKKIELEKGFKELIDNNQVKNDIQEVAKVIFNRVWGQEIKNIYKEQAIYKTRKNELEKYISNIAEKALIASSPTVREVYERKMDENLKKIESIKNKCINIDFDHKGSPPYRTALDKVSLFLKSPYSVWVKVEQEEKQRLFFFLFEERLPYDLNYGYRTDKIVSTTTVFEDFVTSNTHNVEVGGIEPPCK